MNWETIGVLAEVAGAVAVVTTLIFLTIEIRRNRDAIESSSVDAWGAGWNAFNVLVMADRELAEIWNKGFADPGVNHGVSSHIAT